MYGQLAVVTCFALRYAAKGLMVRQKQLIV